MHLEKGARWADGKPVTAKDVCFTVNAVLDEDNPVSWENGHRDVLAGCTVEDRKTAVVQFSRYVFSPREWLMIPVLPAHVFKGDTRVPVDHPIGQAAFGSQGMRGELTETGARFWDVDGGERPFIKHWELRALEDQATALADVEAGRAHGLVTVPPPERSRIAKSDDIYLKTYDLRTSWFLAPNPALDPRVREAVDWSIGRISLRERYVASDPDDPTPPIETSSGPFIQSSPYYNRTVPVLDGGDLDRAAALRRETDFERPLRLVVRRHDDGLEPGLLQALVAELEAAGWSVEAQVLEAEAPLDGVDLVLAAEHWGAIETPQLFKPGGSANPFGTLPPSVDRYVDAWWKAPTDHEAQKPMHELHALLAEEHLLLGLLSSDTKSAWRTEVRANTIAPFHYFTVFGSWRLE